MDREAWWATVHGVVKSQTGLSDFTLLTFFFIGILLFLFDFLNRMQNKVKILFWGNIYIFPFFFLLEIHNNVQRI